METIDIRSIVVGTDLGEASDRLVRTASAIAALTGAELHVVHVKVLADVVHGHASPEVERDASSFQELEERLEAQVRRSVPAQYTPTSRLVIAGPSPSEAIRRHAAEVGANLIVIGPHRGPPAERRLLGTSADRLVSTAGIPCLIVREGPTFPLQRIGVLVDFSPAAQAALDVATAWVTAFCGQSGPAAASPTIHLGHIVWSPEDQARSTVVTDRVEPALERAIQRTQGRLNRPEGVEYVPQILHAGDATQVVAEWVKAHDLPIIVVGTRGTSRLPYVYLGGLASALARSAPCSVLLVPPDYAPDSMRRVPEERVGLRRVVTGVDFHDPSWEAALWAMRYLAPTAEHELIHVIDLPDLPGPLRALGGVREQVRAGSREAALHRLDEVRDLGGCSSVGTHVESGRPAQEILRLATEIDADLIVVGEQGPRRGVEALLGSTAERVLLTSGIPVLVARRVGDTPPRQLLAAIDSSEVAARVLDWTASFLDRFDATATIVNVVDRLLLADELVGIPSVEKLHRLEADAVAAMRRWLQEQLETAGLPADRVQTRVLVGDPSYEIIAEGQRVGADLVLVGSRGDDIARTPLIGRIVNKVVRSAPCSVLVVARRRDAPPLDTGGRDARTGATVATVG